MKTTSVIVLLMSLTAAVSVTLTGCGRRSDATATSPAPAPPPAKVWVSEARVLDMPRSVELPGTVRAFKSARLAPKIMGTVTSISAALGQFVKEGDVLVKISASEINAKLAQAETALAQATRDLDRERALLAKEASTADTVRNLEDRQRIAQAQVDEARAMLGYTTVTAPFSGVVVGKFADEGDLATPGQPLLAIENPARLRVETDVPESFERLPVGSTVTTFLNRCEIHSQLAEVAPVSDATTRTFTAKIDLPAAFPSEARLPQSGQFAKVVWPTGEKSAMLVVPESAIWPFGQMERVYVVGAGGRASWRLVKTGAKQNGMVEILAGLSAGEKVVTGGGWNLRDDQPVEVQP